VKPGVWVALCKGIADGSVDRYPSGARYAILAMVKAHEGEAEGNIRKLLSDYGWSSLKVTKMKLLDDPFKSDDPDMLSCYNGAIEKDGGIMVYSDPILEDDPPN